MSGEGFEPPHKVGIIGLVLGNALNAGIWQQMISHNQLSNL